MTVTITRVIDNHDFLMYFDSLNLKIGDKLTILGHQPLMVPLTLVIPMDVFFKYQPNQLIISLSK